LRGAGLEYLERRVEPRIDARPRKIVPQDRLKRRVAGDAEIRRTELEDLPVIDDVFRCFLAGTPFRHRVCGDGRIAVFSYHRYGSHLAPTPGKHARYSTVLAAAMDGNKAFRGRLNAFSNLLAAAAEQG
jgi:hypothetical protein